MPVNLSGIVGAALEEIVRQGGETTFATAAQGAKADSAIQPDVLATVATSGAFSDLLEAPSLGTAAGMDATDFASMEQGLLAETALQPGSALIPAIVANSVPIGSADGTAFESVSLEALRELLRIPAILETRAAVASYFPIIAPAWLRLMGYYVIGDCGGALYRKVGTEPTHPGKFSVTQINGSVVWYELAEFTVHPQMFGARADAVNVGVGTDDTEAVEKFRDFLAAKRLSIGVMIGMCRYNPTGPWDVSGLNDGYTLLGRRKNGDGFFLDPGKTFSFVGANCFYHRIEHVRVHGNVAGPAMRIGKDDKSDAFNGSSFILTVNNNSLSPATEGLRVNYVCNSSFFVTVNCGGTGRPAIVAGMDDNPNAPGYGAALVLRQATFCNFMGAAGQANVGVYFTNGAVFANKFDAFDIEEVYTDIKCDGASVARNTFANGQILGHTNFDCTAGDTLVVEPSCNVARYAAAGASIGTNLVGVEIRTDAPRAQMQDPALPASNAWFKNTTGGSAQLQIWAGNVSLIRVKAVDGGIKDWNPQVIGEGQPFILPPNWEILLTYSAAPSWRWFPV